MKDSSAYQLILEEGEAKVRPKDGLKDGLRVGSKDGPRDGLKDGPRVRSLAQEDY